MASARLLQGDSVSGVTLHALHEYLTKALGDSNQLAAALESQGLAPDLIEHFTDPQLTYGSSSSDIVLVGVIHAASQALGIPMETLGTELGRFLLPWAAQRTGYLKHSIHHVSRSFIGFARVLNQLLVDVYLALGHNHPGLPEAHITQVTSCSFALGVFLPSREKVSRYSIMLHIYRGIMYWAAEDLYETEVQISAVEVTELPSGQLYKSCTVTCSPEAISPSSKQPADHPDTTVSLSLDPCNFKELHPFHFVLSLDLRLLQAGAGLKKILPATVQTGIHIQDVLNICIPKVPWTAECLQAVLDNDRVSRIVLTSPSGVELSGGLHRVRLVRREGDEVTAGEEAIVFLGSPSLATLGDMKTLGLYLSDFPPHDKTADHVLLAASRQVLAAEALREAQRSNFALKQTLQDALATQQEAAGWHALNVNSAGHTLLQVLDSLLMGEEVGHEAVLTARAMLLRAGSSLWKPLDIDFSQVEGADGEVAEALAKLLGSSGHLARTEWHLPGVPEEPVMISGESRAACKAGEEAQQEQQQQQQQQLLPQLHAAAIAGLSSSGSVPTGRLHGVDSVQLMLLGTAGSPHHSHGELPARTSPWPSNAPLPAPAAVASGSRLSQLNNRHLALTAHRKRFTSPSAGHLHVPAAAEDWSDAAGSFALPHRQRPRSSPSEGGAAALLHRASAAAAAVPAHARAQPPPPTPQRQRVCRSLPGIAPAQQPVAATAHVHSPAADACCQTSDTSTSTRTAASSPLPEVSAWFKSMLSAFKLPKARRKAKEKKQAAAAAAAAAQSSPSRMASGAADVVAATPASTPPTTVIGRGSAPGTAGPLSPGRRYFTNRSSTDLGTSGKPLGGRKSEPVALFDASKDASLLAGSSSVAITTITGYSSNRPSVVSLTLAASDSQPSSSRTDLVPRPSLFNHNSSSHLILQGAESSVKMVLDTPPLVMRLLSQPQDALTAMLQEVDEWQFDSFKLDAATNRRPLSCLAFHLMSKTGLVDRLKLDAKKLARYLMRIEDGYRDNPYHCRIHAADVLRSLHVILLRGGALAAVAKHTTEHGASVAHATQDHEVPAQDYLHFTCYLAAIIHDYEHRGVTNDFLIKSFDPLALRYNDISPHEMHHAAAALSLMQAEEFAFMPTITSQTKQHLRRDVVELVLATDMKQHFALCSNFKAKLVQQLLPRQDSHSHNSFQLLKIGRDSNGNNCASNDNPDREQQGSHSRGLHILTSSMRLHMDSWDREAQMLVLKMALKTADLGHLTSHADVHKAWVARLEEEMFRQGDRERALGQPVSPLMDRTKGGITKSQCGFFTIVAQPMFKSFALMFPEAQALVNQLDANFLVWKAGEGDGSTSAPNNIA